MGRTGEDRRDFLAGSALTAGALALDALLGGRSRAAAQSASASLGQDSALRPGNVSQRDFRRRAYELRVEVARQNREATPERLSHPSNGDEERYPRKFASYTKGLKHEDSGDVVASAYDSLLRALASGKFEAFEAIEQGGARKQVNPQSGLAFELIGGDPRSFVQKPPPAFASAEEAAEIAENYWMALLRDVPFAAYASHPLAQAAAADLTLFGADAKVPKDGQTVTPALLFRGLTPGDRVGPYLSQFFYQKLSFGANAIDQRITSYASGHDYMTSFDEYLAIQRGSQPAGPTPGTGLTFMRNGRDLGTWVRVDVLFQAYFQAALILIAKVSPRTPKNPYVLSKTQIGSNTLGDPGLHAMLGEVAARAINAVWYQKWFVHRRLRPENFAARVHKLVAEGASYPIHTAILDSIYASSRLGGYMPEGNALLPMAYPEGCPLHPAYGAGHATVAGACVTILKAWFDGSAIIADPKEPTLDGTDLVAYTGPALTVEGELNKVASNVAMGRNIAGVHWRSDATESLRLGEAVALQYLREHKQTLNESIVFELRDFAGNLVKI